MPPFRGRKLGAETELERKGGRGEHILPAVPSRLSENKLEEKLQGLRIRLEDGLRPLIMGGGTQPHVLPAIQKFV